MSARKTIRIERPDGEIPGLLKVNAYLAEHFGVVVAAVIDTEPRPCPLWVGTQLREATIEGESIVPGDVLVGPERGS